MLTHSLKLAFTAEYKDTSLIRTIILVPKVSVVKWFHCIDYY